MHNANAPLMGGTFWVLKGGRISGSDRENSSYKFPQLWKILGNYVSLRLDPGGKILIIFEIERFSKEEPPLLLFTH